MACSMLFQSKIPNSHPLSGPEGQKSLIELNFLLHQWLRQHQRSINQFIQHNRMLVNDDPIDGRENTGDDFIVALSGCTDHLGNELVGTCRHFGRNDFRDIGKAVHYFMDIGLGSHPEEDIGDHLNIEGTIVDVKAGGSDDALIFNF